MNKRIIDFTPKETIPAALVKSVPEIIILPKECEDGRYLFIGDICQILSISRSSAYRLIDKRQSLRGWSRSPFIASAIPTLPI